MSRHWQDAKDEMADKNLSSPAALSRYVFKLWEEASPEKRQSLKSAHENTVSLLRLHWLGLAQPTERAASHLRILAAALKP